MSHPLLARAWGRRRAILALPALYLAYILLQAASFLAFVPGGFTIAAWKGENIADDSHMVYFDSHSRERGDEKLFILREAGSGAPDKWYSRWLSPWSYAAIKDGAPVFFPLSHVASSRPTAQLFPANHDLITTDAAFATGPSAGIGSVRRLILADGAAGEMVIVVRNAHQGPNGIILSAGRMKKKFTLENGGVAIFGVNVDENGTLLYNGAYVEVSAVSGQDAVWMIGATDQAAGDLYMEAGQISNALKNHARSLSAYSLLRIMDMAGRMEVRLRALAEIEKRYPRLYAAITHTPPEKLDWEAIAGYPDSIFAGKARRPLPLGKFARRNMPQEGSVIPPGGSMIGPSLALTQGEYAIGLRWKPGQGAQTSFTVEVRMGKATIARKISGAGSEAGAAQIPFSVKSAVDYPLEIKIGEVSGAPVEVEEVLLSIDYLAHAQAVIRQAMDALKRKKI